MWIREYLHLTLFQPYCGSFLSHTLWVVDHMVADSIWTENRIAELGQLWREGLSTAEIGRRLGISKNAVVGKAHRLNLPSRPSPIRNPPLRMAPRPQPEPEVITPPPPKVVSMKGQRGPTCQWPHGHPGSANFHFCGEQAAPGKPYCEAHIQQAYVQAKSRDEAAA